MKCNFKTLTVGQLIKELQRYDPTLPVEINNVPAGEMLDVKSTFLFEPDPDGGPELNYESVILFCGEE